ncbi:hypothetical protein [Georgenia sp. SUBG003]|uniref:hypothetical protein n=1 Tax=Georgenia sp. SUBG003 TaxID=1497974 RepID=UPI003AB7C8CB
MGLLGELVDAREHVHEVLEVVEAPVGLPPPLEETAAGGLDLLARRAGAGGENAADERGGQPLRCVDDAHGQILAC